MPGETEICKNTGYKIFLVQIQALGAKIIRQHLDLKFRLTNLKLSTLLLTGGISSCAGEVQELENHEVWALGAPIKMSNKNLGQLFH